MFAVAPPREIRSTTLYAITHVLSLGATAIGAYYVGCVGDDCGDVSDGGDVEDSHDIPCNLSIHWNVTNACTRTALNTICLVIVADFWFYFKYLRIRFFHISQLYLLDSWASSSH